MRESLRIGTVFLLTVAAACGQGRNMTKPSNPALDGTPTIRDASNQVAANAIRLEISPSAQQNSDEGYDLTIASTGVRIVGASAAGVFYGVQTIRQLLPWSVELRGARPPAVAGATGHIVDRPRFVWRGAMLDVARHFYSPLDVK